MKPRSKIFNRLQRQTSLSVTPYYDSSTNPWTLKEYIERTENFAMKPQDVDILTCPGINVIGNKHSPNAWWFNKTFQRNFIGSYSQTKFTNNVDASQGFRRLEFDGPTGDATNPSLEPPITDAYNKALAKLNEKLRGDVDLSVDMAQSRQVKEMIRNTAKLEHYTRGFSKKTLANNWLAFTYGWKPLASSLYGSLEQVYSMANASKRCVARSLSREKKTLVIADGIWTKTQRLEAIARVLLSFDYTAASPKTDQLSRLTSLNPVSIAWELVPYSFVVDWFYDIGGFLRATESYLVASTGTLSNGYQTTTSITTSREDWIGRGKALDGWNTIGSLSAETSIKRLDRVLLPFWPLPRRPIFKIDLGASRLISAASLLAQHLGTNPKTVMPERTISTEKWNSVRKRFNRR